MTVEIEDAPFKKAATPGVCRKSNEVGEEEKGLILLLSAALCELEAQPPSFNHVCRREVT